MRNLCSKCPHYYEQHGYECDDVDWGCTVFGSEFENCPSFYDGEGNADFKEWGCNENIKQINFKLNRSKKRDSSYWKSQKRIAFKCKVNTDTIKTESGYKVFGYAGNFIGYSTYYMPNRKGGHRHNHIYNVCNRILFRSKNGRKICIENKREWREIFELQVFGGMNPFCRVQFLDILKKGKYFKQIKRWRLKK